MKQYTLFAIICIFISCHFLNNAAEASKTESTAPKTIQETLLNITQQEPTKKIISGEEYFEKLSDQEYQSVLNFIDKNPEHPKIQMLKKKYENIIMNEEYGPVHDKLRRDILEGKPRSWVEESMGKVIIGVAFVGGFGALALEHLAKKVLKL